MIGVTAKSFLQNQGLCDRLTEECSDTVVSFADRTRLDDSAYLLSFLHGVSHWICGREPVDEVLLSQLPGLRVISKYGVGLDNIDLKACHKNKVEVRFRPGVNAQAVAELSIGLMLAICRNIAKCSRLLSQGIWWKNGGVNLSGQTVGVIGCGAIGSRVLRLARAFGCKVLVCDILDKTEIAMACGAEQVGLEAVLAQSDFVSLHVPLTDMTRHMIDQSRLQLMKHHAYLINTSRGEVIQQDDLKNALRSQRIAGAALDVFENEPLLDQELYLLDNFIGTAHIAGNSRQAVEAMGQAAIDGVKSTGSCFL